MALKFTVHGVQSFIKGHRQSGVISIKHSRELEGQSKQWTQGPRTEDPGPTEDLGTRHSLDSNDSIEQLTHS